MQEYKEHQKTNDRLYTFMIVSNGKEKPYSLKLPFSTIKKGIAVIACILLLFVGFQIRGMYIVNEASKNQEELALLRANKEEQEEKIKELATLTEQMQEEMAKVSQLENEVKRKLSNNTNATSRSGIVRIPILKDSTSLSTMNIDELTNHANKLKTMAVGKQKSLSSLKQNLITRDAIIAATPSIWPASGKVTSRFGGRNSPGGRGSRSHKGIDIAGRHGSPIYATAAGVVEVASWYHGYGRYIKINHGYGFHTVYGHNSSLLVKVGDKVKKGQVIAYMGNTGVSTGTHCHYEVIKNGVSVNPDKFL